MRAFLFLIPLAAHAAAAPCDPACDPKCDPRAKAAVSVVSCDPVAGAPAIRVQTVNGSPLRVRRLETSSVRATSPSAVSVGHGASCSAQASTSAGGVCESQTTMPSTVAVVRGEPVVVEFDAGGESLAGLAQVVRGARSGGEVRVLDDEAREEIRAAIEEAREAQREAAEDAREAMREARAAQREAADEVREALREAEETRRDALREAEIEVRRHMEEVRAKNPQAFGGDADALARDALESAREALEGVDFEAALAPLAEFEEFSRADWLAAAEGGAQGLEERIQKLERIAQGQGHDTTDGSLEERVAALERALGARKPSVWRARTLPGNTVPEAIEFAPRGYVLYGDGKLGQVRVPRAAVAPVAPVPPVPAVPSVSPVAPVPPVGAVPPVTPRSGGRRSLSTTPAPTPVPSTRPAPSGDERGVIEDAMQSLRSEAEALRAEMQRLREQIDSLPRNERR